MSPESGPLGIRCAIQAQDNAAVSYVTSALTAYMVIYSNAISAVDDTYYAHNSCTSRFLNLEVASSPL